MALVPTGSDDSEAADAIALAAGYGLIADDWQRYVLRGWLGVRADGRWAAPRCGLAVPRQNGKTLCLEIRELYGTILRGERFLHTAHEVKSARKAFQRLLYFFDNPRTFPELHARVASIRRTNGQEAITLKNGGSVEFIARSKGSGRGFTVDVLVCDEAQQLSDETLSALLFTISASPLGNPQQIYAGTPPTPLMNGEVFTRMHEAGLMGTEKRLCWQEWSNLAGTDPDDHDALARANPALGADRVSELVLASILDERAQLGPEGFCRERLGVWDDTAAGTVITPAVWAMLADRAAIPAPHVGQVCLGVDSDPSRARTSITAAGLRADGMPMVELVENLPGVDWARARVVALCAGHDVSGVVIDKRSAAASLITALEAAGLKVLGVDATTMARACGRFYDAAVETGTLRHLGQIELTEAVKGAIARPLGDAWAWDRKRSTDITPLTSATLALWGLTASGPPRNAGHGRVLVMS